MAFDTDPKVQEQVRQLEAQQKANQDAFDRTLKADQRRIMARTLKNKILFYTALVFALVLVWQKLHIVIFIPGSFTSLFIILGCVFLALYLGLSTLFRNE